MKILVAFRPDAGAPYSGQTPPMIQGRTGVSIGGAPGLVFYVIEVEAAFEIQTEGSVVS